MENCFEMMVARCIKIGTVQTLTMLGLLPEVVTISQAEDIYGKRLITFRTGNSQRNDGPA